MMRMKWSKDDVDNVRRLYEGGMNDADIAMELNRTIGSISNIRQSHKINRPTSTLKRSPCWTDEEIYIGSSLYAIGIPNDEIAKKLGRSRIAIKRMITTKGWTRDSSDFDNLEIFPSCRAIPGFSNYLVSDTGAIYSAHAGRVGRRIRPWMDDEGYLHVTLRIDGKDKRHSVHRLVAFAFHGHPPTEQHHAAHENGNQLDNRSCNVIWKTPSENQADRLRHGTAGREPNGRFIKSRKPIMEKIDAAKAMGLLVWKPYG